MKEMQRREIPEVFSKNVKVNWLLVFQSIYTERCTTTICILEQNFHFIMKWWMLGAFLLSLWDSLPFVSLLMLPSFSVVLFVPLADGSVGWVKETVGRQVRERESKAECFSVQLWVRMIRDGKISSKALGVPPSIFLCFLSSPHIWPFHSSPIVNWQKHPCSKTVKEMPRKWYDVNY